jgi:hypothetical protein
VKRLMMLVTVVLVMTALLAGSAVPAMAAVNSQSGGGVSFGAGGSTRMTSGGTPLPTVVCQTSVVVAPNVGWRGETCWVFHPVAV